MKSKITIDARWLEGGIGTYTSHLLEGLSKLRNEFDVQAITRERHRERVEHWCSKVTIVNIPIYTFLEQWAIPRAAQGCDLLHIPHYNASLARRGPMVVSILDLIHITDEAYRNGLKSRLYASPMLKLVARRADHIVTISEHSKTQIVERLGVSPSKVTRIYCGVDDDFHPRDRQECVDLVSASLGISGSFILYVGSLKSYKNVSSLLKAFALLRARRDIPQKLIILGDDRKGKPILTEESRRLKIEHATMFLSKVPAGLLPRLYAAADILVMPSKIEGFGLPVLEAMACGTPVICSSAASLPEVGGDAVHYFDPSNPDELAEAMELVLESSELRAEMSVNGLEQARRFSWEESTQSHAAVYRHLLS